MGKKKGSKEKRDPWVGRKGRRRWGRREEGRVRKKSSLHSQGLLSLYLAKKERGKKGWNGK